MDQILNARMACEVKNMIKGNQLHQLRTYFQEERHIQCVNNSVDAPHSSMNSLEKTVSQGSWKMTAFFLSIGADPQKTRFDGVFYTAGAPPVRYAEYGDKPIPGYKGLKILANLFLAGERLEKMVAFLWIAEWAPQASTGSPREDIVTAITNIRRLDPPNGAIIIGNLKDTVLLTQLAVNQHSSNGLEDAVTDSILCHVAQNFVWKVFSRDIVEYCIASTRMSWKRKTSSEINHSQRAAAMRYVNDQLIASHRPGRAGNGAVDRQYDNS